MRFGVGGELILEASFARSESHYLRMLLDRMEWSECFDGRGQAAMEVICSMMNEWINNK